MELSGYFAVARRWWWTLLVAAWVAGLAGFYVAGRIAPTYESQVKLLVGPINADSETLRSSGLLVQTYAQVVTTPTVINEAIKQTGAIGVSPGALAATTRVIANDQTRILTIRVQDGDATQAAKLANGIANQMVLISNSGLTRPEGSLQIIQDAVPVPRSGRSPDLAHRAPGDVRGDRRGGHPDPADRVPEHERPDARGARPVRPDPGPGLGPGSRQEPAAREGPDRRIIGGRDRLPGPRRADRLRRFRPRSCTASRSSTPRPTRAPPWSR